LIIDVHIHTHSPGNRYDPDEIAASIRLARQAGIDRVVQLHNLIGRSLDGDPYSPINPSPADVRQSNDLAMRIVAEHPDAADEPGEFCARMTQVLAHELGHLKYRHSLRMLIQGSVVGFVLAWYIGDVSSVAAGLPALLLQARYSREHEREADRYAAQVLNANGIPPQRLADMLTRLETSHANKNTDKKGRTDDGVMGYLASHPATRERIEALEH